MIMSVTLEIIVAIITLALSYSFWSCAKSPRFLGSILGDYERLKVYLDFLGKDTVERESEGVDPSIGFPANLGLLIQVSITAFKKTRNLLFVPLVIILAISFLWGWVYLMINGALFLSTALLDISSSAKNSVMGDVHSIILNIYKWDTVDHSACEQFCRVETSQVLGTVYQLISYEWKT